MPIHLQISLTLTLLAGLTSNATSCPHNCGNISDIPYPFGVGNGCYRSGFKLICNDTKLFLRTFEVLEIDHLNGRLRINAPRAKDCYYSDGARNNTTLTMNLNGTPFSFSADQNWFIGTGCDTVVVLSGEADLLTGCIAWCQKLTTIKNNTCNGIGCCKVQIPLGLKYFQAEFRSIQNHSIVSNFNPCSYGFIGEVGVFNFSTMFLSEDYMNENPKFPAVLDWSIEDKTCEEAKNTTSSYACRSVNSHCVSSNDKLGYLCKCSKGYEGNPYKENGCQDIMECDNPNLYPCKGLCDNILGSYKCSCPPGKYSDDPMMKECTPKNQILLYQRILLGLGGGVILILILSFMIYYVMQKRRLAELKQKMFQQHGGIFLLQQISSHQATSFKIFTANEMERATNNYSDDRILGKGGHGMVYKGILDDNRVVGIKKSMVMEESKTKEFAREMIILSQINHINIVKLLGCCLEVEVPMMVYEYVPNGTLFHYIHVRRLQIAIPLSIRLRIAAESAEALAYLHSAASPPILHGDVKSSNILLDDNYIVKVSDFGTSILAPNDKAQFTTLVQGTCGYLDPEYMQTCELTEKSDVYSFGVVLLELLTSKKAISFGGLEGDRSLVQCFITCMKQNKLLEILDSQIVDDEGLTKQLLDVCELALQCLSLRGDERPTSKEVLVELGAITRSGKHPSVEHHTEEMNAQIPSSDSRCFGEDSNNRSSDTTSYDTIENALLGNSNSGR